MKQKFCKSVLCLMLALVCLLTGCNVALQSDESHDFINTFYPSSVNVNFLDFECFEDAVKNGNQNGGYFLTLKPDYSAEHRDGLISGIIRFNIETNKNCNSISQDGGYYDKKLSEDGSLIFKFAYICYEMKNAPENLSFEHGDYDAGMEEADYYGNEEMIFTGHDKIINISDQNGNLIAKFAYFVTNVNIPSNEFFEQLITDRLNVIKGGILPHADDVEKPYLSSGYELTKVLDVSFKEYNYYKLEEETQAVANKNKSSFAVLKMQGTPGYFDDGTGYYDHGEFYFKEKDKKQILMTYGDVLDSQLIYDGGNPIGQEQLLLYFLYASYELKTEPKELRFEHYINEYGNYNRLILVYDESNNLILEFSYRLSSKIASLFLSTGAYCGDKKMEEFITKSLIFIKGE